MLSQFFTLDELGRIQKIERDRRNLARNDRDVFLEFAENVKKEKLQSAEAGSLADEIAKKRELLKKAKEKNKNTSVEVKPKKHKSFKQTLELNFLKEQSKYVPTEQTKQFD